MLKEKRSEAETITEIDRKGFNSLLVNVTLNEEFDQEFENLARR